MHIYNNSIIYNLLSGECSKLTWYIYLESLLQYIKIKYKGYTLTYLYSQTAGIPGSGLATLLPFILIGVIFYFLIIRPQSKEKKQHSTMLAELKKGNKILTRGGLYGKVVSFQGKNNQKITIDIGSSLKANIARSYIVDLQDKNESE